MRICALFSCCCWFLLQAVSHLAALQQDDLPVFQREDVKGLVIAGIAAAKVHDPVKENLRKRCILVFFFLSALRLC